MGNCGSSSQQHHHVRVGEERSPTKKSTTTDAPDNRKETASNNLKVQKPSAVSVSDKSAAIPATCSPSESDSGGTLPLTPASAEDDDFFSSSSSSSSPPSKQRPQQLVKGADTSSGAEQPPGFSPPGDTKVHRRHTSNVAGATLITASSTSWATASENNSNNNKGRALQQRLQKARYMQLVMSSPMSGEPSTNRTGRASSATRNLSEAFASPVSIHASASSDSKSRLSNDEFEASLHQGMIWAEIDGGSSVLATALSRQEPTLGRTNPPLFLAVGTEAGLVTVTELFDCKNGPRLGTSKDIQRQGRIRSLDFLPGDGNCLAVGGDDGVCALVGLPENGSLHLITEIPRLDRIYAAKFSPDAQFLAIGGYDATVAIFDVTSLTAPHLVSEIQIDGLISTLAWSPDSLFLAVGGSDKVCSVVSQQDEWQIIHEVRRPAPITALEWHPQGRGRCHLAIASNDVVLVDHETFQIREEISFGDADMVGRSAHVRINDLCWSPNNGKYLVVCANNQRARLLETKTFSTIQEIRHNANINCAVWGQHNALPNNGNPHQQYLAVGGDDGKVLILKAGPTELYGTSDDNTSAASSSYFSNRNIARPQKQSGEGWVLHPFRDMDDDNSSEAVPPVARGPQVEDHSVTVRAMAFSRGSKSRPSAFFATASVDGFVTVRSTTGYKILCQLEFLDPITCITFSYGSQYMACGSNDGKVRIITTEPWTVALVIDAETPVTDLCFSKNNERLAITGNDGVVILVKPQLDFAPAGELEQESTITATDWCPDYFAVGQEDGAICIYDTKHIFNDSDNAEMKASATLTRPSPVRTLAFGANGRFLVVGGDDGVLAVFSSAGQWALIHCISVGFEISSLSWSPSGRHLAVTGGNPALKEKKVRVVDTVFWANVEEAEKVVAGVKNEADRDTFLEVPRRRKNQVASLTFSQDGKFMAFNDEDYGTRVVNTLSWDMVFYLQQQDQETLTVTSSNSSPGDGASAASSMFLD